MIALEIHICDQRRSYTARFATEDQALTFLTVRGMTHAFHEIKAEPVDWAAFPRLYDYLYPECEHGMRGDCYGPQHYYMTDDERRHAGW
ncbi:hypothetical protein O7635_29500 [Asanoa sp. WMMD1127]|uniref:hypothetical protein n=1 Tax=Asanoa sp. WMMD1127 TaxID=3016107 RepID=UPI00241598FA|nr:hypothetical protein [Asanoa sp. WMMD1127]MDG4826005.1 hypothetical protein [Asanoa sp. WMMD1127]